MKPQPCLMPSTQPCTAAPQMTNPMLTRWLVSPKYPHWEWEMHCEKILYLIGDHGFCSTTTTAGVFEHGTMALPDDGSLLEVQKYVPNRNMGQVHHPIRVLSL